MNIYKPAVPLPGFNSRETFAHMYQCTKCHSSLVISPQYNSHKYPSTLGWVNDLWCSHMLEYYTAVK